MLAGLSRLGGLVWGLYGVLSGLTKSTQHPSIWNLASIAGQSKESRLQDS